MWQSSTQIGVNGPILSIVSVVASGDRSGVGRAERGLVSRKDGGRSGRARFELVCVRDTAQIQQVLIEDRYAHCPTLGLACVLMSRPIFPELVLSPDL